MYFTHVIYLKVNDKIYVGQTNNLKLRLDEHNKGLSKYTRKYIPWKLIYYEKFTTRTEAMKREKELKTHKRRDFIREELLSGGVRRCRINQGVAGSIRQLPDSSWN